jgi:hypothetical protein
MIDYDPRDFFHIWRGADSRLSRWQSSLPEWAQRLPLRLYFTIFFVILVVAIFARLSARP